MVEWFKAAVLKTAEGRPSVGSNPTSSASFLQKKWRRSPSVYALTGYAATSKASLHCAVRLNFTSSRGEAALH